MNEASASGRFTDILYVLQFKFLVDNVWCIDDRLSCCQDNTNGAISNFILVTEQGLITPIIESFTPSMVIANEIPQPMLAVNI